MLAEVIKCHGLEDLPPTDCFSEKHLIPKSKLRKKRISGWGNNVSKQEEKRSRVPEHQKCSIVRKIPVLTAPRIDKTLSKRPVGKLKHSRLNPIMKSLKKKEKFWQRQIL